MRNLFLLILLCASFDVCALKTVYIAAAENFSELNQRDLSVAKNMRASMQLALEAYKEPLKKKGVEVKVKEFSFSREDLSVLKVSREMIASNVVAVVGFNTSTRALLAAPLLQKAKLPMLSTLATATRLSTFGSYVHVACVDNNSFSAVLAKVARERLKAKRVISIAAGDCAYCTDLTNTFKEEFLKNGGEYVDVFTVLSEQTDFTELKKFLKDRDFDVILNPNHKLLAGRLIVALSEEGIAKPYLFADGWGSLPELLFFKIIGKHLFSGFAVDHWHHDLNSKESKDFVSKFEKNSTQQADTLSALWFDATALTLKAILDSKEVSRVNIEKSLKQIKNFSGVTGNIDLSQGVMLHKPTVLLKANGKNYSFDSVIPALTSAEQKNKELL